MKDCNDCADVELFHGDGSEGAGATVGSCPNSCFLPFGNAKRQEEGREVFVLTSICQSIIVPLQVPDWI